MDAGEDDPLYEVALAVEADETLAAEMAEWEAARASCSWPHVCQACRPACPPQNRGR